MAYEYALKFTTLFVLFTDAASAAACAEAKLLLCKVFGGEVRLLTRSPLNGLTRNTRNACTTSYSRFELGTSKTQAKHAVAVRTEICLSFMYSILLKKLFKLYGFLYVKLSRTCHDGA
jgi:hypothetical protein